MWWNAHSVLLVLRYGIFHQPTVSVRKYSFVRKKQTYKISLEVHYNTWNHWSNIFVSGLNRNTGTGNGIRGMRGTRGMGEMLYSGNVTKHSGERRQTFQGMSSNILGNVAKYSGECRKTFLGMSPNIPGNVLIYSGECHQTFRGMSLCRIAFIR